MPTSSQTARRIARRRTAVKAKLYGLGIPSLVLIARAARIEKSTLSMYLSGRRTNCETRERILRAANSLAAPGRPPQTFNDLWDPSHNYELEGVP